MINKEGLIFLTLTSLILVLSVYYVTMPSELLLTTNSMYSNEKDREEDNKEIVSISNTDTIMAMKNIHDDERKEEIKELNNKLTNKDLSIEERNNVYEEIQVINKLETMENDIQEIIKQEHKLDSFVKVNNDIIEITISSKAHDTKLAAKIISSVEKKYPNMYISVSFKD